MKYLGILFKPGVACSWCQQEAIQQGIPLQYDPNQVSHGLCPEHYAIEIANLEAHKQQLSDPDPKKEKPDA